MIRRLLALPWRQKVDVLTLLSVIIFIEAGLRLVRLNRLAQILGVHLGLNASAATADPVADLSLTIRESQRLDIGLRILRRGPFNGTCLRSALLAAYVLRKHDHAVRVGVRSVDGLIAAHAWLEVDGISLDPDADEQFARLVMLPETSR